jgi:hypothetical protein
VRKIDLVIVRLKSVRKGECVIPFIRVYSETRSCNLILYVVLVVLDVSSNSVPAKIFSLAHILTVTCHFHSGVIKTIWLG